MYFAFRDHRSSLTYWQVLFALCASVLVRDYATYAKHSGIPEIKVVLGGFVMQRLMGFRTLVVKSLGLVSIASARRPYI